jgi:hypothetical protein
MHVSHQKNKTKDVCKSVNHSGPSGIKNWRRRLLSNALKKTMRKLCVAKLGGTMESGEFNRVNP